MEAAGPNGTPERKSELQRCSHAAPVAVSSPVFHFCWAPHLHTADAPAPCRAERRHGRRHGQGAYGLRRPGLLPALRRGRPQERRLPDAAAGAPPPAATRRSWTCSGSGLPLQLLLPLAANAPPPPPPRAEPAQGAAGQVARPGEGGPRQPALPGGRARRVQCTRFCWWWWW